MASSDSESELVKSILLDILGNLLGGHHLFHSGLSNSVGVQNFEELSELIFLAVISILNQNHGESAILFSEVYKIEESAFAEFVDGDVSKPDKEFLVFFF